MIVMAGVTAPAIFRECDRACAESAPDAIGLIAAASPRAIPRIRSIDFKYLTDFGIWKKSVALCDATFR
jgi:hypothetical protein